MRLTNIGTVKGLMEKHGISFQKRYGQNFLINEDIPMRIANECGASGADCVLEIGPGIGTLTRELCSVAGNVVAVEIDTGLIPVLEETLADLNSEIVQAKINTAEWKDEIEDLKIQKYTDAIDKLKIKNEELKAQILQDAQQVREWKISTCHSE